MSESYPPDADINALSGTRDAEQEVQYPAIYETPYYTTFYKMIYRLLNVARRAGDFRIYKDGNLTFGARGGRVCLGNARLDFNGVSAQHLTDNASNCIYITADGELQISTTGFPAVETLPHIPLAIITTSGGNYDFDDINDLRGMSIFSFNTSLTPQNAQTLTTSQVADSLHKHSTAGISPQSIGGALLNSQLRKRCRYSAFSATDNADGTASLTISVKDASGAALEELTCLRLWTSASNLDAPSEQVTLSVQGGVVMNAYQANADLQLLTSQNGAITLLATSPTNKSFRVHIEIGGSVDVYSVSITGN